MHQKSTPSRVSESYILGWQNISLFWNIFIKNDSIKLVGPFRGDSQLSFELLMNNFWTNFQPLTLGKNFFDSRFGQSSPKLFPTQNFSKFEDPASLGTLISNTLTPSRLTLVCFLTTCGLNLTAGSFKFGRFSLVRVVASLFRGGLSLLPKIFILRLYSTVKKKI